MHIYFIEIAYQIRFLRLQNAYVNSLQKSE